MVGESDAATAQKLVKVFNCPTCSGSITMRAQGVSMVCVCNNCRSVIDVTDERHQVLTLAVVQTTYTQYIPLGTRGKLKGQLWEVIGFMVKIDEKYAVKWGEYLLYNPARGFRWLIENNGHWNYIVPIKSTGDSSLKNGYYGGKHYSLFHEGTARVLNIWGEFYWRVSVNDVVTLTEFVNNNEILSKEVTESETHWTIGEYIDPESLKVSFKMKELPVKNGIAPNQPNTATNWKSIFTYWGIFVSIIVLLQFLALFGSQDKQVLKEAYQYVHEPNTSVVVNKEITTQPFILNDETANVQIILESNVLNSWLYVAGTMVNVNTGEAFEFDRGVEFYSGYDGGESWSEGRRSDDIFISGVPGGTYQISFEASGDMSANYNLVVKRDVIILGNVLWALALLSIIPFCVIWIRRSFEVNRWSQSDYSPYPQHHGE